MSSKEAENDLVPGANDHSTVRAEKDIQAVVAEIKTRQRCRAEDADMWRSGWSQPQQDIDALLGIIESLLPAQRESGSQAEEELVKQEEGTVAAQVVIPKARSLDADPRYDVLEDLTSMAVFVVEASGYERQSLWERWAKQSSEAVRPLLDWRDCGRGWLICVGETDGRPINISILGATLNGHHVLFYEAVSQVIDWKLIEEWFETNCWPLWDGTRRAHCDAMNFHHCCEVVEQPSASDVLGNPELGNALVPENDSAESSAAPEAENPDNEVPDLAGVTTEPERQLTGSSPTTPGPLNTKLLRSKLEDAEFDEQEIHVIQILISQCLIRPAAPTAIPGDYEAEDKSSGEVGKEL